MFWAGLIVMLFVAPFCAMSDPVVGHFTFAAGLISAAVGGYAVIRG